MPKSQTLRAFLAIPLPPTIISQLDRIQRHLQHKCPNRHIRWVNPHTIHLTLYFIGDMPETQIPQVSDTMKPLIETVHTFNCNVENLGTFPNTKRPNVIWAGIQDSEMQLTALHALVNQGMSDCGFSAETRKFTPHLTIGRVNRRTPLSDRMLIGSEVMQYHVGILGSVEVTEVVFYKSILKPTGAEHIPRIRFPLKQRL
ncbi:MAG: RNA 2',3'-cyclic phosphodiesterase [Anaerolineae bacterium]|nr:RNA 2',3'-cyclic phosphodiesterase [Anaerolineae bacterium]